MKSIFIDLNSVNDNGSYRINELVVKNMKLKTGDKVIAYQDFDSWEGEIIFEEGNWGVVLVSSASEISKERQEGHKEGFWDGYYLQSVRIIRVLEALNYSTIEINIIRNKLGLE